MNEERKISIFINLELLDMIKRHPDLFYVLCWSMANEYGVESQETFDDILFRGFDQLKSEMIEKVEVFPGELN